MASAPYLQVRVKGVEEAALVDAELEALGMSLKDATRDVLRLVQLPRELTAQLEAIDSPAVLADFIGTTNLLPGTVGSDGVLHVSGREFAVSSDVTTGDVVISVRPEVPPKLPSIWNGGWASNMLG